MNKKHSIVVHKNKVNLDGNNLSKWEKCRQIGCAAVQWIEVQRLTCYVRSLYEVPDDTMNSCRQPSSNWQC